VPINHPALIGRLIAVDIVIPLDTGHRLIHHIFIIVWTQLAILRLRLKHMLPRGLNTRCDKLKCPVRVSYACQRFSPTGTAGLFNLHHPRSELVNTQISFGFMRGLILFCSSDCHLQPSNIDSINTTIIMLKHAVEPTPEGHPDKTSLLNNVGSSLLRRFERLGDLDDINKSILMFDDAVRLTPEGHPSKPSRLNSLGNSLARRFKRFGDLDDISKSILMVENAVRLSVVTDQSKLK
jgi:hypothetical protein